MISVKSSLISLPRVSPPFLLSLSIVAVYPTFRKMRRLQLVTLLTRIHTFRKKLLLNPLPYLSTFNSLCFMAMWYLNLPSKLVNVYSVHCLPSESSEMYVCWPLFYLWKFCISWTLDNIFVIFTCNMFARYHHHLLTISQRRHNNSW
jgi:hypothetical protein